MTLSPTTRHLARKEEGQTLQSTLTLSSPIKLFINTDAVRRGLHRDSSRYLAREVIMRVHACEVSYFNRVGENARLQAQVEDREDCEETITRLRVRTIIDCR
jgi:hypothetical protein